MTNLPARISCAMLLALLLTVGSPAAAQNADDESAIPTQAPSSDSSANRITELPIALVVHGGAGTILKGDMTPELEAQYRIKLREGLRAGFSILETGGSSLDAIEATIKIFEDSPLFNAGRGAVFTAAGRNELDASVMNGHDMMAGAVASVTTVRHPISAARAVMEQSEHVMLAGEGANEFARQVGLEQVDPSFFFTERRWEGLERARERESTQAEGQALILDEELSSGELFSTVGAVALDRSGHLAAGTSTGGRTNKRFGRIGDSPIIGAGTWADARCGVSATGHGEYFIRYAVAYDICARVRYLGSTVEEAAETVIHEVLAPIDAEGGVITLDSEGNVSMPFNSAGMYRGYIKEGIEPVVLIYK